MELHKILYTTITTWEIGERVRRDDYLFDAWFYFAGKIGHKNPSTLRKMCQPHQESNAAKLGLEEAITIMSLTHDFRLLRYIIGELRRASTSEVAQMDLFSRSVNSIDEAMEDRR